MDGLEKALIAMAVAGFIALVGLIAWFAALTLGEASAHAALTQPSAAVHPWQHRPRSVRADPDPRT
jgi:uncharacterized membrane protein